MRKVTTTREASVLEKVNAKTLLRTGSVIALGTRLNVGEAERLGFDHGNLIALPFDLQGKKLYILARDVGENLNDPLALKPTK